MFRRLTVVLLTTILVALAGPAYAGSPTTTTQHQKGLVETFVDVIPNCEGGGTEYTITTTSNSVQHETLFNDGRVHVTFTSTGTFSAVPLDTGLPSYTGKFTIWGGFNANGETANGTFTFNVRGTGSDGSTFSTHLVEHFNQRPDGTVNDFFHCH